jgi:hypothetical protein
VLILIGSLILLPMLGAQLGLDPSIVSQVITISSRGIIDAVLRMTGNTG